MSCGAFTHWLDEGMPEEGRASARAHAAGCAACRRALEAAERVEALLASPAPAAPGGFADRVLARIAAEPRARPLAAPRPAARRLPWWSWIGAEPALPVALAIGSVLLGLVRAVSVLVTVPIRIPLPAIDWSGVRGALSGPPLQVALVSASLLTPVIVLSLGLYFSIQGMVRSGSRRR
jgi:hypothetical protein